MVKDAICGTRAEDFLVYLGAHGSARFTDIEEALDATPNLVTRRLDELREAGLVEKRDGVYEITPQGRAVTGAVTEGGDHPLCEEFCDPEICLPDVTDVDGALQRRAGSWLHGLLDVLPADADRLADAVDCPAGSIERCLAMAERWDYLRRDEDVYVPTRKADRLLPVLDAAQGVTAE